ncbi:MAG: metal-dependent hydrolase [Methanocorpusculum sp.]|nr:metal-dependent hydrolase [Methanocorpusculum sp.]
MKGSTHILLTLLTALVILAPLVPGLLDLPSLIAALVLLLGIFFGSITPDIDKGSGSAIFHSEIPGAKGRKFHLTPIFGYLINFTCYKPLRFIFRIIFGKKIYAKQGHRELPHSPIGVFLIALLLTLYIWLICFALSLIPGLAFFSNNNLIFVFGAGFLLGCFLHLVEDTCDNSGIHYLYPFSFSRLRGTVVTDGSDKRPTVFAVILAIAAVALCALSLLHIIPQNLAYPAALLVPIVLWVIFLRISGVPARKSNRE